MASRIKENEKFLEAALEGFLVIIAVVIMFFNCVPWLKWQQELTVLKEQTKHCYFTKSTTKKSSTQFVLIIGLMSVHMHMFYLETEQKLSVPSTAIVIGIHISRPVQVNNYLRFMTDIANQFSCRQFTFSGLRKDLQLVFQHNYPHSMPST